MPPAIRALILPLLLAMAACARNEPDEAESWTLVEERRWGVHDPRNQRFSGFSENGTFISDQMAPTITSAGVWGGGIDPSDRVWDPIYEHRPGEMSRVRWRRFAADWSRIDTVDAAECKPPAGRTSPQWIQGRGGSMAVPFAPPSEKPMIEALYRDDQNRIWIQRLTRADSTELDLDDERGVLLATIRSPFRPRSWRLPVFRGERVYVVYAGDDDIPYVTRARIVRH